jgi:hypothetical protein
VNGHYKTVKNDYNKLGSAEFDEQYCDANIVERIKNAVAEWHLRPPN